MTVYNQTRKIFPRFAENDAKNLIEFFQEKNIYYKYETNPDNNELNKLFFSTKRMQLQYEKYGNIVIVDTTYRVNIVSHW